MKKKKNKGFRLLSQHLIAIIFGIIIILAGCTARTKSTNEISYESDYVKTVQLKDDYYTAINKEKIIENIPNLSSEMKISNTTIISNIIDVNLINILEELESKENKTRKEQMLMDFYHSGTNLKLRNQLGYEPIKPYLENYKNANSIEELINAEVLLYKEMGISVLFNFQNDYIVTEFSVLPILNTDFYKTLENQQKYQLIVENLLVLAEHDDLNAKKISKSFIEFEVHLFQKKLTFEQQLENVSSKQILFENISDLFDLFNFRKFCFDLGYPTLSYLATFDFDYTKYVASFFSPENLELLKNYGVCRLLLKSCNYLSEEFVTQYQELEQLIYGTIPQKITDKTVKLETLSSLKNFFPSYLDEIYIKKYCSTEIKENIVNLAKDIVNECKLLITNTELLNEKGKRIAIRKLEKMTIKVGFPEVVLDYFETKTSFNPQNYLQNCYTATKEKTLWRMKNVELYSDKFIWRDATFLPNAYYDPYTNSFTITAGFLQAPNYSMEFSYEEILGKIGFVIAHEISHSFDKDWINYNHLGSFSFVWDEKSLEKYKIWYNKIEKLYNGYSDFYGIANNGKITVSENIADIVGMQICLNILNKTKQPNYEKFFKSYAQLNFEIANKQVLSFLSQNDKHALPRARVNLVIANFQEFYDTYGITNKDDMYIKPEDRVRF